MNATMTPHFIIIGAQKAGSSSLQHYLNAHPDISLIRQEANVLQDPFYSEAAVDELLRRFPADAADKVRGIKRPNYLNLPEVPARIERHFPDAKLLVTLRDPVERIVSAYFHYMQYGVIPVAPIERGLRAILRGDYDDTHPAAIEVREYGFYGAHLARYYDRFPAERIAVILFADLVADGAATVQRLYEFLGVDPTRGPSEASRVVTKGTYSLPRARLLAQRRRFTHDFDRARGIVSPKRVTTVGRYAVSAIDAADRMLSRVFPSDKPRLDPELVAMIRGFYAEDGRTLERVLGTDAAVKLGYTTAERTTSTPVSPSLSSASATFADDAKTPRAICR